MSLKQLLFTILLLALSDSLATQNLVFEALSCNALEHPIAVENKQPLLSWKIKADGFNREQLAYQILVASAPNLLTEKGTDVWNSHRVASAQSVHVKYQGSELLPMHKYWWKVRIWDKKGQVSTWSAASSFEMGLVEEANWGNAKWMAVNKDTRTSPFRFRDYKTGKMKAATKVTSQPVGYFRKEIHAEKQVKSARAYICGLGYYELYLNGEKTGDHVLDPAPSNYDKQAYYLSYDVTEQIRTGKNAIGLILGNGFYGQNISWKRDPESERDLSYGIPAARLFIKLTYIDDTQATYYSDESWKVSTGPIVFDNIYGGDTYDARFELGEWNQLNYDDSQWEPVRLVSPVLEKISAQQIPPIRKLQEFAPQRIFKSKSGKWILDFGQNIAGWVQVKVKEKKGQVVQLALTEALTQQGDDIFLGSTGGGANGMRQILTYICKGEATETWEPKFTYHGFRYAEITGISTPLDPANFKAILVATDVEEEGSFHCSDPLLNKMDTVSKWTIVNNLHGIPEDCPHREKCGWLGDAHAFCEYALYNYELDNFYMKYMEDIRTQMRLVPGEDDPNTKYRVPTMIAPGRRTSTIAKLDWGIATIYLPWYNYLYYGDSTIVQEYYEEMKGLTQYYLSFKNEEGIIENGMGDWCPPRWDRRANPGAMECHPVVSANAYFYDILGIMEYFAKMNGDDEFAEEMLIEKKQLFAAFNSQYLTAIPSTNHKWYGSQTATVMALQFGIVPPINHEEVINGLVYDIQTEKGGHHSTGIHGNRYIYTVLSKYGKADLAHDILTIPTFPSQTYILNYGFTTWPERQFEWEKKEGLTNSLNHPMHSGFAAYFFEMLAGIKPIYSKPGYKEFTVKPIFPSAINETNVDIPTPYGKIHNSWEITDDKLAMNLKVPFNTKARLLLSATELQSLTINGTPWNKFRDKYEVEIIYESAVVLGSGSYQLTYEYNRS